MGKMGEKFEIILNGKNYTKNVAKLKQGQENIGKFGKNCSENTLSKI